jgi:hypothetical protein
MSDKKQHIDEIFRRRLAEHTSVPPPELWAEISSSLSGKRRRSLFLYVAGIAAAGLLLLGSGGIMYFLMQGKTGDNYLSPGNFATHSAGEEEPETDRSLLPVDKKENKVRLPFSEAASWPEERTVMAGNNSENRNPQETGVIPGFELSHSSETGLNITDGTRIMEYRILSPRKALKTNLNNNLYQGLAYVSVDETKTESGLLKDEPGTDVRERHSRWSAMVMLAPNYSYRTLSSINSGSFTKEHYNSFESGLISVSGSINLNYRINDRFSVQSGIDLLRMGQTLHRIKVFNDLLYKEAMTSGGLANFAISKASLSNSFGYIEPSYSVDSKNMRALNYYSYSDQGQRESYSQIAFDAQDLIQGLYYLQTPILLKYQLIKGKTGITVSGGPGINLLIGNRVMLKQEGNNMNIGHTRDINRFSLSGIVAVGMERRLSDNIRLLLEPRFSHFISPVNSAGSLLSLPYSFSIFGGLSYGF